MTTHSDTLRHALQGAINSRKETLRNGRCRRKDIVAVRASIAVAEQFLRSYPVADDERVRDWCKAHFDDVLRIVPGNQPRVLAKLVFDELKRRADRRTTEKQNDIT